MARFIYHLALVDDWEQAVERNETYYPPTYEADGFTHGTAEKSRLLEVANHFYQDSPGDWLCLRMTEDSLAAAGVAVVFEPAASVGDKDGAFDGSDEVLFPHLMGGIPPESVVSTHAVTRDEKGRFQDIDFCVEII